MDFLLAYATVHFQIWFILWNAKTYGNVSHFFILFLFLDKMLPSIHE